MVDFILIEELENGFMTVLLKKREKYFSLIFTSEAMSARVICRYVHPWKESSAMGTTGCKLNLGRDYLLPLPSDQLVLYPNLKQN